MGYYDKPLASDTSLLTRSQSLPEARGGVYTSSSIRYEVRLVIEPSACCAPRSTSALYHDVAGSIIAHCILVYIVEVLVLVTPHSTQSINCDGVQLLLAAIGTPGARRDGCPLRFHCCADARLYEPTFACCSLFALSLFFALTVY